MARSPCRVIHPNSIVAFVRFAVVSCHLEQTALFWWQRREIDSMGEGGVSNLVARPQTA